jgi:hypothetical protein
MAAQHTSNKTELLFETVHMCALLCNRYNDVLLVSLTYIAPCSLFSKYVRYREFSEYSLLAMVIIPCVIQLKDLYIFFKDINYLFMNYINLKFVIKESFCRLPWNPWHRLWAVWSTQTAVIITSNYHAFIK